MPRKAKITYTLKNKGEEFQVYDEIEKTAKAVGTGACVYVPKSWTGKRVKVLLMEDISEED